MSKTVHYIGLDVHKETIAVAIAPADDTEVREYGIISGTLEALQKLIKKIPTSKLRFVYEAGPCGYVIYRFLKNKGLPCAVVAPSLIPKKASDAFVRAAKPVGTMPTNATLPASKCLARPSRSLFRNIWKPSLSNRNVLIASTWPWSGP